jgi:AraC family transcriptional regulator
MTPTRILPLLDHVRRHLDGDVSLPALAARVRGSKFELHRAFRRIVGETPKQYALRLRLDRAATELLATRASVLDIALAAGFDSHEVFTRAFRRQFGITPREYRGKGLVHGPGALAVHADLVRGISPCIGLYGLPADPDSPIHEGITPTMTAPTVDVRTLSPQTVLVTRRRIRESEVAATLGQILPAIFMYAQKSGFALAGQPFTRYLDIGRGAMEIEGGMAISGTARGEGAIELSELPGGTVAVATHIGPYDKLADTHGVIDAWLAANASTYARAGAPWEVYVTDPGETPNPAEWKTDVFYPIKPAR